MKPLSTLKLNAALNTSPSGNDRVVEMRLISILNELAFQYGPGNVARLAAGIDAEYRLQAAREILLVPKEDAP